MPSLARQPNPGFERGAAGDRRYCSNGTRVGEVIKGIRALVMKAVPAKTRLVVNEAIRAVLALTKTEADKQHVLVRTELCHQLPAVSGDKVELQQVILNLVSNGIESMASITHRSRVLLVRSDLDAERIIVAVQDSGVGLASEQMGSIFDAFFTTKPGGMGMGLPISRSIIEAHGGKL